MKKIANLFNWKLFFTLIFISLIPTIYTTIRIYFLGEFDDPYVYSVASQISWLNVFFEIMNEAIIIPLFFLISKRKNNSSMLINRIKTGFYVNFIIYFLITIVLIVALEPLMNFLVTDDIIREKSRDYIFLELVASFFSSIFKYILVVFMVLNKNKKIIITFLAQMFLIILFDTFFISKLSISLNLSIMGIGASNILTNFVLILLSIFMLYQMKIKIFDFKNLNFKWMIQYWKIGIISGAESLIRNLFFTFMVLKILNDVSGSGDYWVANGFIWSWLLLPILSLGNTIKTEGDSNKNNLRDKLKIYFLITGIIIGIWLVTIPSYSLFIENVLNVTNYQFIFKLVMILLPFYIIFALNSVIDGIIIGWGRTDLLLYQSIFANVFVYVPYFIALKTGTWVPSVEGVAIMFGLGIALDSLLTIVIFILMIVFKKELKIKFNFKKKEQKIFVFGIPTTGKSTITNSNPNKCWDSETLYQLIGSINGEYYNTLDLNPNLSKKVISNVNKELLKSKYKIIFWSILPISLYEEIDWLINKGVKIIFVNRIGSDYQYEWCKREKIRKNKCHLKIEEAELTSKFIDEQAIFFEQDIKYLERNVYLNEDWVINND